MMAIRWLCTVILTWIAMIGADAQDTRPVAEELRVKSLAFLSGLDDAQRARAQHAYGGDAQEKWTYLPGDRIGLALRDASPEQREAMLDIVRTALSATGWERIEDIRALEVYLRDVAKSAPAIRDPHGYFFAVFGQPDATGTWGLRYEGHHISLHWQIEDGAIAAAVPQFLGSNPWEIPDGPKAGTRILGRQEAFARELLASLTSEQASLAVSGERAPGDIVTRDAARAERLPDEGVPLANLNADQQRLVLNILHDALAVQSPAVARLQWDKLEAAGTENIRFLWIGGTAEGEPHYFRIQGHTFLYEYNNVQNRATHVHTVWRDFNGDFGRDLLAEHMQAAHSVPAE